MKPAKQRIKREIELGHVKNPEEVIAHALELLGRSGNLAS
jgi:hypothetical protein